MNTTTAQEVFDAYSDSNNLSNKDRVLDFISGSSVDPFEATKIMTQALGEDLESPFDEAYNAFAPIFLLHLPLDTQIRLAREGSVCVYVKSATIEGYSKKEKLLLEERLNCDEFDRVEGEENTYRIWWD